MVKDRKDYERASNYEGPTCVETTFNASPVIGGPSAVAAAATAADALRILMLKPTAPPSARSVSRTGFRGISVIARLSVVSVLL